MLFFQSIYLLLYVCLQSLVNGAPISQDPTLDTGANLPYALPTYTVASFPEGTWIENLAVRQNGRIIVTEDTKPRVYEVDPFSKHSSPVLIHEFNETASILGIAEGETDVFYVCTGNYSSKLLQGYGEGYVFRIDLRTPGSTQVSKVATVPDAGALDGLVYLGDESRLLLSSDFLQGVIWSVNVETGDIGVAINNTYTQSSGFAVNGLRLHGQDLYFTNSQKQALVKVPINSQGEPIGDFTVLAEGGFTPDDLAVDSQGDAYVTSFTIGKNGLAFIPREGGNATYIAGMAGPTACAFGRTTFDRDILYISTSGGDYSYLTGDKVTVAGKILKVDVERYGK
ncbi:MAG: hypothetical protein M1820_002564 [Bogoriella megaspora]|nr:MAG: hypothetical protein M1820_002564 [Bogoriella megaspora]